MSQFTEPSIDERIARRRARTAELKKKRKRQMIVLLSVIILAIILLAVVVVFMVHAFSNGSGAEAGSANTNPDPSDPSMQIIQSDVKPSDESDTVNDDSDAQPDAGGDETQPNEGTGADSQTPPDTEGGDETGDAADDDTPPEDTTEDPAPPVTVGRYAETVIYVDPGRGYSDLGCTSDFMGGLHEQQINLDVALQTAQLLTDYGFTVLMTHDTNEIPAGQDEDYVLDQYARVDMANHSDCVVYLSIHCDYFPTNPDASGTRLYYCSDVSGSAEFAESLSESFSDSGFAAPRIYGKDANNSFIVTSQVTAPSVLVELGFVTNEADAEALCSADHRTALAEALAAGVIRHLGLEE